MVDPTHAGVKCESNGQVQASEEHTGTNGTPGKGKPSKPVYRTVAELAGAKQLPDEFLRQQGLEDIPGGGIAIPYWDESGAELHVKTRGVPNRPRFYYPPGVIQKAYGLWRLADWHSSTTLYVAEGESDTLTLWYHGLPALGLPGSGSFNKLEAEHLIGIEHLYIPADNDKGGKALLEGLAKRLAEIGYTGQAYAVHLPEGVIDVSELHCRSPGSFRENLAGLAMLASKLAVPAHPSSARKEPEQKASNYTFVAIDSRTFFTAKYTLEWIVKRLLVALQPGIIGGPRKCLKTCTLMDLAVSIASGTRFLGYFPVYKPRRVLMMSGESGEAVLQETGRRICAARGIDPTTLNVYWSFRLPQLCNPADRAALRQGLKDIAAEVVILDPLYLCLLAGLDAKEVEAGNLFHMGPLLADLARDCIETGCTPLLCHHARKNVSARGEPMELDDLAFAGIQEFARQWLLENRREPFNPETGSSKLWLSAGGSAGQSGLWAVDVEEGVLLDDFTGRKWEVSVHTSREEQGSQVERRLSDTEGKKQREVKDDGVKVLLAIDNLLDAAKKAKKTLVGTDNSTGWVVASKARALAHLSGDRMTRAVQALVDEGVIEQGEVSIKTGKNMKVTRTVDGVRRAQPAAAEQLSGLNERGSISPDTLSE